MTSDHTPGYVTVKEYAATMKVSERTVRRWISTGELTVKRVGGTVRIPTDQAKASA